MKTGAWSVEVRFADQGQVVSTTTNALCIEKVVPWVPHTAPGLDVPEQEFTSGQGAKLSVQLISEIKETAKRNFFTQFEFQSWVISRHFCSYFTRIFASFRAKVRRCIPRRRAVSEMLKSECTKTSWMCSHSRFLIDVGRLESSTEASPSAR